VGVAALFVIDQQINGRKGSGASGWAFHVQGWGQLRLARRYQRNLIEAYYLSANRTWQRQLK